VTLRIYDGNCLVDFPVESTHVVLTTAVPGHIEGHQDIQMSFLVKSTSTTGYEITESPYFKYVGQDQRVGTVDVCIRFILYYDVDEDGAVTGQNIIQDYEAVTFKETDMRVEIDFDQFRVRDVKLTVAEIQFTQDKVDANYLLNAYQCDGHYNPNSYQINQVLIVWVCLNTTAQDIGINSVSSFYAHQTVSNITFHIITEGAPIAIASSHPIPGTNQKSWVVSFRLILPFFDNHISTVDGNSTGAQPVEIHGTAITQFQGDVMRRLDFSTRVDGERRLEEMNNAPFDLNLSLVRIDYHKMEIGPGARVRATCVTAMVLLATYWMV